MSEPIAIPPNPTPPTQIFEICRAQVDGDEDDILPGCVDVQTASVLEQCRQEECACEDC